LARKKSWTRVRFSVALACVAVALAAMGAAQPVATPAPTGTNAVGTHSTRLLDLLRDDPLGKSGIKRELMVQFWYPTASNANCLLADYSWPKVWIYLSQLSSFPLPRVKTHSCSNVPVAEGRHPVIIFSHGYTGAFTDVTFLFEELASRGCVVVSTAHSLKVQPWSCPMAG
jgi:predicted dienelactone hydrolase